MKRQKFLASRSCVAPISSGLILQKMRAGSMFPVLTTVCTLCDLGQLVKNDISTGTGKGQTVEINNEDKNYEDVLMEKKGLINDTASTGSVSKLTLRRRNETH